MLTFQRLLVAAGTAVLFLVFVTPAAAQLTQQGQSATVFRYAEPGQPTLALQVWGDVRAPGLYVIERDTDLIRLLSLAGGPHIAGERPRQRIHVTVSVSRVEGGVRQELFEAPLEELHAGAAIPPALQEGDIVLVDTIVREVFHWRDAATLISTTGTLALLVLRIMDRR